MTPVLTFGQDDDGRWHLVDRRSGEKFYSPKDKFTAETEYAYIGRVPVGDQTMILIAGIHTAGSVIAVDYLTHNLDSVFGEVGTERFSMLVSGVLQGETVSEVEVLCAPRLHRQFES
jgi:hypothetical protein